jgi:hypothetical protein
VQVLALAAPKVCAVAASGLMVEVPDGVVKVTALLMLGVTTSPVVA